MTESTKSDLDVGPLPEDDLPATPGDPGVARNRWRRVIEWALIVIVAFGATIGIRTFFVQTFFVPSSSMYPTLQIGDRILVSKLPVFRDHIGRGAIIVFRRVPADTDPTHPADLVKRVIGLPGETISSRGDTVLINGRPIAQPWLTNPNAGTQYACPESAYDIPKTKIPAGHYFVMGDCRGNSYDSRDWGTVPSSYVIGQVFAIIWRNNHPYFHWF